MANFPNRAPGASRRATYHTLQQESELVVAIMRAALIVLAVLAPTLSGAGPTPRLAMQISASAAAVYNLVIVLFYWRRIRAPGQRLVQVLLDVSFATLWIALTWTTGIGEIGSPLFPFYYVIIVISALWFGIQGSLMTAGLITVGYLWVVYPLSGYDPFALIDALVRQVVYVFLVAMISGYLVDTHKREREQWTRSQVLLAQYQERFRAAQEVYELLIPPHPPQIAGLDLAARWRPALQEGGGDFYDVIQLDSGRVVITIADVSGKHMRGALKLPLFKAAFMATAQVWEDPGQVLSQVNRIVYPLLQPDMFITACVVVIDPAQRRLYFANAGQDPPVFVRERTRDTERLETGGLVLGIDARASYPTEEIALEPGDTFCLYTDGVTEARDAAGEEFGQQNLEARVMAGVAVGLPADDMAENIYDAVNQHMAGESRHDDLTLLVVRYRPTQEGKTPA